MLLFFGVRLLSDTEFEKKHMKPSGASTPTSCPPYLFAVLTIRCTLGGCVALPFLLLAYEICFGGRGCEAPCV